MSNGQPEDYLSIETPENVAFGYKVAGIGSRFLAALVDTLIIFVLQIIVLLALILFARLFFVDRLDTESPVVAWLIAIFGLISFAFLWGYYILFEMLWNGQSPGKRWVGLRVIRTDGTPLTLTESIIRNLVRLVDFLPAYYGVGVVTMFINEQSRRLGDLAAGTLVVHDRAAITLESLTVKPPLSVVAGSASAAVAGLPVERLSGHEIEIAEDFLRRRYELANRSILARRILQALLDKMGVPASQVSGWHEESLLAEIVRASRSRKTE
ncbi:MAG: RDD family protein [Chloroflexi bacterium]|nr:RDD family protein [Chloroflexota bacterium]